LKEARQAFERALEIDPFPAFPLSQVQSFDPLEDATQC
jgi:hypothetical protein